MSLLDTLIPKARAARRTLVLAEGHDPRVMHAAVKIARQQIAAKVIVLATPEEAKAASVGVSFEGLPITILDYPNSPDFERLAQAFYELRKLKGRKITVEGWLLWDWEHCSVAAPSLVGKARLQRGTVWEVHPVTKIEVQP